MPHVLGTRGPLSRCGSATDQTKSHSQQNEVPEEYVSGLIPKKVEVHKPSTPSNISFFFIFIFINTQFITFKKIR